MTEPYDLLPELAAVLDDDEWDAQTDRERMDALATIDADIRCEQLLRAIRNIDTQRACLLSEIDRLKAKLNSAENRKELVRAYLQSVMVLSGRKKVKTPIATATITAGRERIVFADDIEKRIYEWPSYIQGDCVKPQPPKIDKEKLKREWGHALMDCPGVSVEVGEDVLTIR